VFNFLVLVSLGLCSLSFFFGRMYAALTWSVWLLGSSLGFWFDVALDEFWGSLLGFALAAL
jgi:hypothetical protein